MMILVEAKHGHARKGNKSRVYTSWTNMRRRCLDPNNKAYKNYGGRGITVSARWLGDNGFVNFLEDMGEPPTLKHTLDRFPDMNGNYCKENCRWATYAEQRVNQRPITQIEWRGETKTLEMWARQLGINRTSIRNRSFAGFDLVKGRLKIMNDPEWFPSRDLSRTKVTRRVKTGFDIKEYRNTHTIKFGEWLRKNAIFNTSEADKWFYNGDSLTSEEIYNIYKLTNKKQYTVTNKN